MRGRVMSDAPEDDPEVRASLFDHGLLSPVLEDWRHDYMAQYAEWFDAAHDINKIATKLYLDHWEGMSGQRIVALQPTAHRIFGRALNNFAAAVTISERGFAIEAASLARAINEASVWLGYMVEKPEEALSDLDADDLHSMIGRHKELRRVSERDGDSKTVAYTHAEEVKLKEALNGRKKPKWETLAQTYGSSSSYIKFRILSGFYSHLSGASLKHYIETTGDKTGWNKLGPHSDQIPNALYFACDAMIDCGAAVSVIFDDSPAAVAFHDYNKKIFKLRDAMAAAKAD